MANYNKQNALNELLDAINKGISLLADSRLEKDLYQAYERYVLSTMQLVDAAFLTSYSLGISINHPLSDNLSTPFYQNPNSGTYGYMNHSAKALLQLLDTSKERYKEDLQKLLQRLVDIVKVLFSRCNE